MPELHAPKTLAALLNMSQRGAQKILAGTPSVVRINDVVVKIEVRRINGRVYMTDKSYRRLVELLS